MADFFSKWLKGLNKTKKQTFSRIASILGTNEITNETWDDLEEVMLQSDCGVETTESLIKDLKNFAASEGLQRADQLSIALHDELTVRLKWPDDPMETINTAKPFIILMVGVNGSGKTTTAAKLAK